MKGILKNPAVNAICISLFSAFYGLIFIITSGHIEFKSLLYYSRAAKSIRFGLPGAVFASGHHVYIAFALIVITMLVVLMLLIAVAHMMNTTPPTSSNALW